MSTDTLEARFHRAIAAHNLSKRQQGLVMGSFREIVAIDEEMLERATRAMYGAQPKDRAGLEMRADVRRALEAALEDPAR